MKKAKQPAPPASGAASPRSRVGGLLGFIVAMVLIFANMVPREKATAVGGIPGADRALYGFPWPAVLVLDYKPGAGLPKADPNITMTFPPESPYYQQFGGKYKFAVNPRRPNPVTFADGSSSNIINTTALVADGLIVLAGPMAAFAFARWRRRRLARAGGTGAP